MIAALFPLAALLAGPFDYDRSLPLDPQEHEVAVRKGIRVSLLTYASPKGGRADAMLVVPAGWKGKTAAIVWVHSQGYFNPLSDAMLMARAGAVSLLLTPSAADSLDAGQWRERMIATVVNIRRAVDLLVARPDVDPRRIAFVGHSYGAMMGCDAAAVDKRFKAAVFEVGLLGMSVHIATSPHPWAAGIRKELGPKLAGFLATIEPLDATHFVGQLAPTALLFQSAHVDPGVPDKDAQAFFNAASEPKKLKWYDTGHEVLDIAAIADRARFLARHLGLAPIEPVLKAKIGLR